MIFLIQASTFEQVPMHGKHVRFIIPGFAEGLAMLRTPCPRHQWSCAAARKRLGRRSTQ